MALSEHIRPVHVTSVICVLAAAALIISNVPNSDSSRYSPPKKAGMRRHNNQGKQNRKMSAFRIPPKQQATGVLIFLHGLGDTGKGWAEQFRSLSLQHTKCVFPNANMRSVTLNSGAAMPAWYDILSLGQDDAEDEAGILDAADDVKHLIAREVAEGFPPERIILGGFSQGGALALYTALGTDVTVGGVLALSTYLPLRQQFQDATRPRYNSHVPVLQCHGKADRTVAYRWGKLSHDVISTFCSSASFKSYDDLGHSSSWDVMRDVKKFLATVLDG